MTRVEQSRTHQWLARMAGHHTEQIRVAHADSRAGPGGNDGPKRRLEREVQEDTWLAPGATHAWSAGCRRVEEDPDDMRTCFERDRDRIVHANAFRRLAGETQV